MIRNSFFKIAFLNIWRDKRNIFFVLLFLICLTLTIGIINFKLNFKDYINDTLKNDLGFRSIIVNPTQEQYKEIGEIISSEEEINQEKVYREYDYKYEILNNIKYVVDAYPFGNWQASIYETKLDKYDDASIILQSATKGMGINILEEQIKQNKKGYAICPINFNITKDVILNGEDFLNKKITITYPLGIDTPKEVLKGENKTREFTIIGLYNASAIGSGNNTCFISKEELEEINKENYYEMKSTNNAYYILVDKNENVDYVLKEIKKLGYYAETQASLDNDFIAKTNLLTNFLLIITLIAVVTTILFLIKKKIMKDTFLIGLLKSFGFREKEIKSFYNLEIIILIFICLVISVILSNIIFVILLKTVFKDIFYSEIKLRLYYHVYLIIGIITILISLAINNLLLKRKTNKKAIDLLKDEKI